MAKEYDPPPHRHVAACYRTQLDCARIEHEHVDRACYYQRGPQAGGLKCATPEHAHSTVSCYKQYTVCGYE